MWPLIYLQPLEQNEFLVSHLKDPIYTCLELNPKAMEWLLCLVILAQNNPIYVVLMLLRGVYFFLTSCKVAQIEILNTLYLVITNDCWSLLKLALNWKQRILMPRFWHEILKNVRWCTDKRVFDYFVWYT